jgi:Mg-chelatase subunit ChlI
MLFGALIQNWKVIALAAIVATVLIYRAVLVHQRDSARAQVTALSDAAAALRADNASMAAAVARQNQAIDALQGKMKLAQRDATEREARYAAGAAQAMSQEVARANAVRNAPIPAGCQGAIEWGNAQGPELGRW